MAADTATRLLELVAAGGEVVTANRRLARDLQERFAAAMLASGRTTWRRPSIAPLDDWLVARREWLAGCGESRRLSPQQCRLLWERALQAVASDGQVNHSQVARQAAEAWQLLHSWRVPADDWSTAAAGADQRLFVRAAARYREHLARLAADDPATSAVRTVEALAAATVRLPRMLAFAGFDRLTPLQRELRAVLEKHGCPIVDLAPATERPAEPTVVAFDSVEAEWRAAGSWARRLREDDPAARIGIVCIGGVEGEPLRIHRCVSEGGIPGALPGERGAVNVSFGRQLSAFPAIHTALILLRWLVDGAGSLDVSHVLLSPFVDAGTRPARARLDLRLRELPDVRWNATRLRLALSAGKRPAGCEEFLDWLDRLRQQQENLPRSADAAAWALHFDGALTALGWPGPATLDSDGYQLVNRWRELLNELARLQVVSPPMSATAALARLSMLAGDTVFQPEAAAGAIDVLGPLEAAGLEFDALWIAGMTASAWPPPGRGSALLSMELQRRHAMPDSTPGDTLAYARRTTDRLLASAPEVVLSWSRFDGENDAAPSRLLPSVPVTGSSTDPGRAVASLVHTVPIQAVADDAAEPTQAGERLFGGAYAIQAQKTDPFTAFCNARLGIRALEAFGDGISASWRGRILHDALRRLYDGIPGHLALPAGDDLDALASTSAEAAVHSLRPIADPVLARLLDIEQARCRKLLVAVTEYDRQRDPFEIHRLEFGAEFSAPELTLGLRIDRMDRLPDGSLVVIDYKSGNVKPLIKKKSEVNDLQLIVYVCALDEAVSGLGLYHVDSRGIAGRGAGSGFTTDLPFATLLDAWKAEVYGHARALGSGRVRVLTTASLTDARPLALLSRIAELRND